MAIQFGWYGTRGTGSDVTDPPVTESQVESWFGTALSVYVSYGLRTQTDWSNWQSDAEHVVDLFDTGDDVKLIMEIPTLAWDQIKDNQFDYIDWINTTYGKVNGVDQDSRVHAFYVDEPNWREHNIDKTTVGKAQDHLGKDLIVMIRPAGAQDPDNPTDDNPANQATYNGYASEAAIIAGFNYPLASSTAEWANIEKIQAESGQDASLHFAHNNSSGKPFWFVVQAHQESGKRMPVKARWSSPESWANNKWHSDELFWMMHRAIYAGAKGVLLYHFNKSDSAMHEAVFNLCDMMKYESAHLALETAPLASSASPDTSWVKVLEGSNLLWSYHYYSSSYWLLVLDGHPESTAGKPQNLKFQCKLGDQGGVNLFNRFQVLNQRYGVEQPDGRGTTIAASNNGGTKFKEFRAYDETDYDYRLRRGEVKLYRFKCEG